MVIYQILKQFQINSKQTINETSNIISTSKSFKKNKKVMYQYFKDKHGKGKQTH